MKNPEKKLAAALNTLMKQCVDRIGMTKAPTEKQVLAAKKVHDEYQQHLLSKQEAHESGVGA